MGMNLKEETRQLVNEARPLIDELESPATVKVCAKLQKIQDKHMELSINMNTGCEHEQTK